MATIFIKTDSALLYEKRKCKHHKLYTARQHKAFTHVKMPAPKVTHLQDIYICKRHDWLEWCVDENGKIDGVLPNARLWTYKDQEFNFMNILTDSRNWPEQPCRCARKVCVPVMYETNSKRVTLQRKKATPSKNKQQHSYWPKNIATKLVYRT